MAPPMPTTSTPTPEPAAPSAVQTQPQPQQPAPAQPPAEPPPAAAPAPDPLEALRMEIANARRQQPSAPQHQAPAPQHYPQPAQPAPSAPPVDLEALNRQFLQNPMAFMGAAAQASQQQVMAQLAPTLANTAKQAVRAASGNPALFDALEPEIEAAMAAVDPVARTNQETWQNAFYLVRGKYHDRLATLPRAAANAVVSGGPTPAGVAAPPAPAAPKLTAEQQRAAMGFGLSESDYMEGNSDGVFVLTHTRK